MKEITKWPGLANAPIEFIEAVLAGAEARGWDGDSLLGHISSESNFKTDIRNPHASATGLIQVINSTARSLGLTTAEIAKMSHLEQLKKVIFPYFERSGANKQLRGADFKLLGFSSNPALLTAPEDYVMYDDPKIVGINKFADMNSDGVITVGDVRRFWGAFARRFGKISLEDVARLPRNETKKKIIKAD